MINLNREKIKRLELWARKALSGSGEGRVPGTLRGLGLEFSGLREYQPGDDIRHIDWKATARLAKPLCREFLHDRETTLLLLFDSNPGMDFGSEESKRETATRIALYLGLAAFQGGNRVSFAKLNKGVCNYIPPTRDEENLRWIAAEMLSPEHETTKWNCPWDLLAQGAIKKSLVVYLSDFWDLGIISQGLRPQAAIAAMRHDLHFFRILGKAEMDIPETLDIWVKSPGGGARSLFPCSSASFREEYRNRFEIHTHNLKSICSRLGIGFLDLPQGCNEVEKMALYFRKRKLG